jgi:hypothetical protein
MARIEFGRLAGQALAYALFFGAVGVFSNSPPYRHLAPDEATIKLSVRHAGQRLGECRTLGAEELARLPPTMRAPVDCPRERSPLTLELDVNGLTVLQQTIAPRGLHGDGLASSYRRLTVPAGTIEVGVRMKDHPQQQEFPYVSKRRVVLAPAQVLVIDFDAQKREFVFR